jgi:hypothetical protein
MNGARFRLAALALGILCLGGSAAAAFIDPAAFYAGWLAGFLFWIGLSLGALMLLMAHDLTGGRWGEAARPALAAATATMPLSVLAAFPLLGGLDLIYPWLRPAMASRLHNVFYLTLDFFLIRSGIYLVIWTALAILALKPVPADAGNRVAVRRSSPPGLILAAITATFSAFDWSMSLQPRWHSEIYGLIVTFADLEGALALATLLTILALRPDSARLNDLGSLLLVGLSLWGYVAYMQFMIIWEENLPDEIGWYLDRIAGGWLALTCLVAALAVGLPFFILVWWPLKRRPASVAAATVMLLLGYLAIDWWLVFPGLHTAFGWPAGTALVGIGGVWLALFHWRFEHGRLFPSFLPGLIGGKHA